MRLGLIALALYAGCSSRSMMTGSAADLAMNSTAGDMATAQDSDLGASAGVTHGGSVTLTSGSYKINGNTVTGSSANASFNDIVGANSPACTSSIVGSCTVLENCTGMIIPGTFTPESAGTVSITGGSRSIALIPNPDGTYASSSSNSSTLWSGGESLTVSAMGGAVPAFNAAVVAPNPFSVMSPTLSSNGITIPRTSDFTVTWSNGGAGTVTLQIQARGTHAKIIECTFPASSNAGTVPMAAFQNIAANDPGGIALSAGTMQTLMVGEWNVTVSAVVPTTQGGAYVSVVSVTFQ